MKTYYLLALLVLTGCGTTNPVIFEKTDHVVVIEKGLELGKPSTRGVLTAAEAYCVSKGKHAQQQGDNYGKTVTYNCVE